MVTTLENIKSLSSLKGTAIALTSMPADPIHPGHISCLQSMRKFVESYQMKFNCVEPFITVCVVNDDNFLRMKKGFSFIPLQDRIAIIDSIKNGADYVAPFTPSCDNDMSVKDAILYLNPRYFLKGGDRKADETLPEWAVCKEIGCTIIDNVGHDKLWSSSDYLEKYRKFILSTEIVDKDQIR